MAYLARRFPAAPLQAALNHHRRARGLSWDQLAEELGIHARTLYRLLEANHISYVVADRVACRLGTHPALLWDEWR